MSGQVQGRVDQGRVPGQQPGHDRDRGALEPLSPAWDRLQQRPGLTGPRSFFGLLRGTKPLFVLRVRYGVLAKLGQNGSSSLLKT